MHGYYLRAATNWGAASIRINMVNDHLPCIAFVPAGHYERIC